MLESSEQVSPETEQAHRDALDAFVRFTEATNTEHDPRALGRTALTLLEAALPGVECVYWELAADHFRARALSASYAPTLASVMQAGLPRTMPLFVRLFSEARAIFTEWDAVEQDVPTSAEYRSGAVYPLWRGGHPFGMFAIGTTSVQAFSERERMVFLAVGRALQLGLERAWHAEEQIERAGVLERQHQALEAFTALTADPSFALDPAAVVQHVTQLVPTLLPAAFVRYWTYTGQRWSMQAQAGQPPGGAVLERLPVPSGDEAQLVTAPRQGTERQPVYLHGVLVGVLEVTLADTPLWPAADRAALRTLARAAGQALERAGQARQQPQALSHAVQAARAELLAFDEALWLDLRRELDRLDRPEANDTLDRLRARLDALLDHAERMRRPVQRWPVDLGRLAASVWQEVMGEHPHRQVTWQLGRLPVVQGDQELLRAVLRALFLNAVRATEGREGASVEVFSDQQPDGRVVYVRDNGVGFHADFAPHVFEPGGQVFSDEGASLGLMTVRPLVERLGGRVWAEGRPGQGETLMFSLPQG